MKELNFLNSKMHALSMAESLKLIDESIDKGQFFQHVVVNVAKLVNMQTDIVLKQSVESCDLINIDGQGVVWGARWCGHDVPERVAGVDLFHELLELSSVRDYPVFLLGATQEVVEQTVQNVEKQYKGLKIAGYHHGYFWHDEAEVVEKIRASGAKLLFVAITSPKKENFIHKWQKELGVNFVMGVGGTFDVVAGKVKRAPVWMQRYGMEWLYRVLQEPKRMFKRYLVTNSRFAMLLLKEKQRRR